MRHEAHSGRAETKGGETDLNVLLARMEPELEAEDVVFCLLGEAEPPPLEDGLIGWFREAEGSTVIVRANTARELGLEHGEPFQRITLNIHSSLGAVGLLAVVTEVLAEAGIPVNVVSAFYHDHLFVPTHRAPEALRLLEALQEGMRGRSK